MATALVHTTAVSDGGTRWTVSGTSLRRGRGAEGARSSAGWNGEPEQLPMDLPVQGSLLRWDRTKGKPELLKPDYKWYTDWTCALTALGRESH